MYFIGLEGKAFVDATQSSLTTKRHMHRYLSNQPITYLAVSSVQLNGASSHRQSPCVLLERARACLL
jgi:hypothetical protein